MNLNSTSCCAYFLIKSAGYLDFDKGFIPEEKSSFCPDEITKILKIEPFRVMAVGTPRPNGKGRYNFSAWYGCRQTEPDISRIEQAEKIAEELRPYTSELLGIKERYNVNFSIQIFPYSKSDCDVIGFTQKVIEFCYLTGTEIVVDMFCYSED